MGKHSEQVLWNYIFVFILLIALFILSPFTFLILYICLFISLVMFTFFFLIRQEIRNMYFDYLLYQYFCVTFEFQKQIDKSTFYAFTSKFPQNLLNKTSFYLSSSAFFLCKDNALEEPFHLVRIKLWENVSGPLMSTKCFKSIK